MALAHIAVLMAALLTLLCVPTAIAMLVCAGDLSLRRAWTRRGSQETRELHRLDRALRHADPRPTLAALEPPTIEQIAYDLRRLDRQRRDGPALESERWHEAVLRAYDARLCLACQCLGLTQHLEPLEGMDREIERVRVEGELQAAGLALR